VHKNYTFFYTIIVYPKLRNKFHIIVFTKWATTGALMGKIDPFASSASYILLRILIEFFLILSNLRRNSWVPFLCQPVCLFSVLFMAFMFSSLHTDVYILTRVIYTPETRLPCFVGKFLQKTIKVFNFVV